MADVVFERQWKIRTCERIQRQAAKAVILRVPNLLKLAKPCLFFGKKYVEMVERLNDRKQASSSSVFARFDQRRRHGKSIYIRNDAELYGLRPNKDQDPRVWYLSPYEFITEWDIQLLNYPQTLQGSESEVYHAALTDAGKQRLADSQVINPKLEPGVDYRVKEGLHADWIAFPESPITEMIRHKWIIKRRSRPCAPMFLGSPVPVKGCDSQRSAMLTMVYFRPWTLWPDYEEEQRYVPYAGKLRPDDKTWQQELGDWLSGHVLSEESVRYINNFMSVYRVRPRDVSEEIRSDEEFSDVELELTERDLERALQTKIGGRAKKADSTRASTTRRVSHEENSRTGIALVQEIWPVDNSQRWGESTF